MMKIKVLNNSVTLTSEMSLETIKTLEQYNPAALKVVKKNKKDEDEEVFAVSANAIEASVSKYGINFTQETEKQHATVTALFPDCINTEEEKNQFLKDQFFDITQNLVIVEKQAKKAMDTLNKELTAFNEIVEHVSTDE